jgi:nucleoside-diphosphate-sugar epimerase
VYNVGTGVQTTIRDAVEAARRVMSVDAPAAFGEAESRHWDTSTWVADPAKIARELGWRATRSFESGLALTRDWLAANSRHWERYGVDGL